MKEPRALERCDRQSRHQTPGQPMTLWDMAMTVREFAKKTTRDLCPSADRLAQAKPMSLTARLSFMGNDGGGAVGTGPGHTIGAALALKDRIASPSAFSATAIISWACTRFGPLPTWKFP